MDTGTGNIVLSEQAVVMLYERGSDLVTVSDATRFHGCDVLDRTGMQAVVQMYGNAALRDGELLLFGHGLYPPIRDAQRTDDILVDVVKSLGVAAAGSKGSRLEVVEIPDCVTWEVSSCRGQPEFVLEKGDDLPITRTWSEAYRRPEVYQDYVIPYVLESDMPAWERPYVRAVNFLAACPVPDGLEDGDYAYYAHDYMPWYEWRMLWGDDWRKRAKTKWWYAYYEQACRERRC